MHRVNELIVCIQDHVGPIFYDSTIFVKHRFHQISCVLRKTNHCFLTLIISSEGTCGHFEAQFRS